MKKSLLPLLVGASMLVSSPASAQNIQKSKEEITQTLSLNGDQLESEEQLRRRTHIQKLIPKITEPIIL